MLYKKGLLWFIEAPVSTGIFSHFPKGISSPKIHKKKKEITNFFTPVYCPWKPSL